VPTHTITSPAGRKVGEQVFQVVFANSLDFRIQLPYSEARDFIAQIGKYNSFESAAVLDVLERIDGLISRGA
jgi:hypothetical protein